MSRPLRWQRAQSRHPKTRSPAGARMNGTRSQKSSCQSNTGFDSACHPYRDIYTSYSHGLADAIPATHSWAGLSTEMVRFAGCGAGLGLGTALRGASLAVPCITHSVPSSLISTHPRGGLCRSLVPALTDESGSDSHPPCQVAQRNPTSPCHSAVSALIAVSHCWINTYGVAAVVPNPNVESATRPDWIAVAPPLLPPPPIPLPLTPPPSPSSGSWTHHPSQSST